MTKLVCFDIDGTLVDHNNRVPDSTVEAINALRANGHVTAIATGRLPSFLEGVRKELAIDSFVSLNGQYASIDGEVVYTNPIHTDDIEELLETSYKFDSRTILITENSVIGNQFMKELSDPYFMTEAYQQMSKIDGTFLTEFFKRMTEEPIKRYRYENEQVLAALVHAVEEEDNQYREALPQLHFTRATPYMAEVLQHGSNKYVGIQALAKHYQINSEDIITFGDSLNDLEMIEYAEIGVAMGNGRPELKKVADFVTDSVDNDGIYKALTKLQLI